MDTTALVITPHASLGESIRDGLDRLGSYSIHVIHQAEKVVSWADAHRAQIAFLDIDLGARLVKKAGLTLRSVNPDVVLVIVLRKGESPDLDLLQPLHFLHRPVRVAEVAKFVQDLSPRIFENVMPLVTRRPPGREIGIPAQQITPFQDALNRIRRASYNQAMILVGDRRCLGQSGRFADNVVTEIVELVSRQNELHGAGDFMRFARFRSTGTIHILFATALNAEIWLAIIFEAETPFAGIRTEVGRVAEKLQPDLESMSGQRGGIGNGSRSVGVTAERKGSGLRLVEVFRDIPPSRPEPEEKPAGRERKDPFPPRTVEEYEQSPLPDWPVPPAYTAGRRRARPAHPLPVMDERSMTEVELVDPGDQLDVTLPRKTQRWSLFPQARPVERDNETVQAPAEAHRRIVIDETSADIFDVSYSCLLVPRMPNHFLTGTLASCLSSWVPNICLSFGWRLDHLAVRPEYMQWILRASPTQLPRQIIRTLRQQTSHRIFAEFNSLRKENPSDDFWALGNLVLASTQPLPHAEVLEFIQQVRRRQGLTRFE